jgi:HK97 gp10 family phage protein
MIALKVDGNSLADLARALKELPKEVASKSGGPLRGALEAAGRVIRDEASLRAANLPVSNTDDRDDYIRTGKLSKSIKSVRGPNPPPGVTEQVLVKPRKRRYWVPVEFGSSKMPARPFMRPAAEAKAQEALDVFQVKLKAGIERAAKKAARMGLTRG